MDKNMENDFRSDVTILVNSCDLYEDAWEPFFRLLKKQWPDCQYPMVLNSETKEYSCDFFSVRTLTPGKNLSWTARLRSALEKIDSEYVLFFLEDFFLITEVNTQSFAKALDLIEKNPEIGMVHFTPTEKAMPVPSWDLEHCFYELPVRKRTLRTRVAVTLFRKKYFLRLLYKDENPWQYERESHIRSMFAGYKIYRQNYSLYPPTFSYVLDHYCRIGITARKWLPRTPWLLESNGITNVDFANLGVLTEDDVENKVYVSLPQRGSREWFYSVFVHPVKRKIRHVWFMQDILNIKKYMKYYRYYKEMDKQV